MQTSLRGIATKAKQNKDYKFGNLNSKGIGEFYSSTLKILYKWLNRRSQRKSFNWDEFSEKMKLYGLIKPKVVEKTDNQIRFEECFA